MPIRRRAWLTREGWYYMAVLAFIVGGAVLRSVNLLVVLAGMMLAPLILNWRLVMASLASLAVRRKLPEQICAGDPLIVELRVDNPRRWMSSWLLTLEDWVERDDDSGDSRQEMADRRQGTGDTDQETRGASASLVSGPWAEVPGRWSMALRRSLRELSPRRWLNRHWTPATAIIAHVPALGSAVGTYRITLHRRGRYLFGPVRVATRFPLGLVRGHVMLRVRDELLVAPRLGRLSPDWATLIEAELVGDQRRHPQRGVVEGDYYGLRPWQSGDSLRWIHWRTTAKLGRPFVRQFERRRNRDVALLLDPWLPDRPTERDQGLLEMAFSLAATAAHDLTNRGHARMTFGLAGERPECWSGPASPLFCDEIFARLADAPSAGDGHLGAALEQLAQEAPAGAKIVVISPRPANSASPLAEPLDLPVDPENFGWIDVSSEDIASLFTLE